MYNSLKTRIFFYHNEIGIIDTREIDSQSEILSNDVSVIRVQNALYNVMDVKHFIDDDNHELGIIYIMNEVSEDMKGIMLEIMDDITDVVPEDVDHSNRDKYKYNGDNMFIDTKPVFTGNDDEVRITKDKPKYTSPSKLLKPKGARFSGDLKGSDEIGGKFTTKT